MAKIEVTSIIGGGKKVGKLIKENKKEIISGITIAKEGMELLKKIIQKIKKKIT